MRLWNNKIFFTEKFNFWRVLYNSSFQHWGRKYRHYRHDRHGKEKHGKKITGTDTKRFITITGVFPDLF